MTSGQTRPSGARPWLAAIAVYAALTCVVTYPLVLHPGAIISAPLDDPLLNAWLIWWNTQVTPLTAVWWNAPMFYPAHGVMAFSELLLGLMPIAGTVQWLSHNPILAHNAAVLTSYPLCALAAHALAFELTGRHDAALLAGLSFGFSPYRATEIGHVQMLAYYGAPLALFALHRYVRTRRLPWAAAFAAAFLLQALCNGYALLQAPVLIAAWLVWFAPKRRDWLILGCAWACTLVPLVPLLLHYRDVHRHYRFVRSIADIRMFSADASSFFASPNEALVLGRFLTPWSGNGLFPGLTIVLFLLWALVVRVRQRPLLRPTLSADRLVLAAIAAMAGLAAGSAMLIGPWSFAGVKVSQSFKPFTIAVLASLLCVLRGPWWRRAWQTRSVTAFYAVALLGCDLLALGPEPRIWGQRLLYKAPYAWLMALPGFESIRVPSRFAWLGLLCLAVLVALAYAREIMRKPARARLLWWVLVIGITADGLTVSRFLPVPPPGPAGGYADASAVLELPMRPENDAPALYRSMRYGRPVINGTSGYYPPHYWALTEALTTRDLGAIDAVTADGAIAIAVDQASADHAAIEAALVAHPGIRATQRSEGWAMFLAPPQPRHRDAVGRSIGVREVRANVGAEEAWRLHDGRVESAWASGPQRGDEQLDVELDALTLVGAVVLRIGSCPAAFPRSLIVDTSADGTSWHEGFRGATAVPTVRAALDDPADVPLILPIAPVIARFIRLRQTGQHPTVPWCVSELSIHQPP